MSARVPLRPLTPSRQQAGFSLLEVSITLMLLGAMSLGTLQVQQFLQAVEHGRQAGLHVAALSDGALRYAKDHAAALRKIVLAPDSPCADIALSRSPSAGLPLPRTCELLVDGRTVAANALQPTIQELQALGYVKDGDSLPFPHGDTVFDGRTGRPAVPRWAVSLRCERHCAPPTGADPAMPEPILHALLYNTQPLFAQGDAPFGQGAQLKAMLQVLGPGAMAALPGVTPQDAEHLKGKGMTPIINPLRGDLSGTGVAGVIGKVQPVHLDRDGSAAACGVATGASGPGSSGAMCRDGSARPTARWDFNGQDLDNVGRLGVAGSAHVAGELSAAGPIHARGGLVIRHPAGGRQTVKTSNGWMDKVLPLADIHGHAVVRKRLVVGQDSNFSFEGGFEDGMSVSGILTNVNGFIDASVEPGGALFDPRRAGIRLPLRSPGQACNATAQDPKVSGGNIALYQPFTSQAVYVMACSRQGKWVKVDK